MDKGFTGVVIDVIRLFEVLVWHVIDGLDSNYSVGIRHHQMPLTLETPGLGYFRFQTA